MLIIRMKLHTNIWFWRKKERRAVPEPTSFTFQASTHHNASSPTEGTKPARTKDNIATLTAVHTAPALNKYASFGDLSGSTSSFKTAHPPRHSTNALSRNRKRNLSEDFSLLFQDDLWFHLVGAVVGLPSLFASTSLLSQQKKRRHSLS